MSRKDTTNLLDSELVRLVLTKRNAYSYWAHEVWLDRYTDHRQRHIGTIYQATNWIYLGVAEYATKQYFYKGKWTHQRTIDSLSNKDQLKRELQSREASAKFKYVYCFDKRLRRKFQKHAKPYPKDGDLQICSGQVDERASS